MIGGIFIPILPLRRRNRKEIIWQKTDVES